MRSAGSAFGRNYQKTKGKLSRSWLEFVQVIVCTFDTDIVFSMLCTINVTIDYMHQLVMLSIYPKLSIHLLTVQEGERVREAVNEQVTMFTLPRLKIVPRYDQELVSQLLPKLIEALS